MAKAVLYRLKQDNKGTTMKTLCLFSKPNSPQAWGVLNEIMYWADVKGLKVVPVPDKCGWNGTNWDAEYIEEARAHADLAIAIGGDGTLLGVARSLFGTSIPVLGVNLGTLGFLTDVVTKEIENMVDAIRTGDFDIENRIMLEACIDGSSESCLAVNDAVLKTDSGRMIEYDVIVDGVSVFTLRADGLVVATPTGSTAYALSANGPILHPSLPVIAVVPLLPHSLSARPITLSSASRVELVLRSDAPARVFCDALPLGGVLSEGARVVITRGSATVPMLHLRNYNFFNTLRTTLGWSAPRER
jgi:NAD+ kinase